VQAVGKILNISTNYVYRLIREGELETVKTEPILITSLSVKQRLMKLVPFIASELAISTDYHIKQHETFSY